MKHWDYRAEKKEMFVHEYASSYLIIAVMYTNRRFLVHVLLGDRKCPNYFLFLSYLKWHIGEDNRSYACTFVVHLTCLTLCVTEIIYVS